MAVNKISQDTWNYLKNESPSVLPDNPSSMGYNANTLKKFFYAFALDSTKSIVTEINRIVDETNAYNSTNDSNLQTINELISANTLSFGELNTKYNDLIESIANNTVALNSTTYTSISGIINDKVQTSINTYKQTVDTDVATFKSQVNSQLSGLASGEPKLFDTSTNILAKTSNSGIALGTDDGHKYYWNGTAYVDGGVYQATEIADGSITPEKTNFVITGKNLVDFKNPDFPNKHVSYQGLLINHNSLNSWGFIKLEIGKIYTITSTDWFYVAFYNDKNINSFVSWVDTTTLSTKNIYTFTANSQYIIISCIKTNTNLQVEQNSQFTGYEDFFYTIDSNILKLGDQNQFDKSNYTLPYIHNMKVCCNKTLNTTGCYAGVDAGNTPTTMQVKFVFEQGNSGGIVALISNPNGLDKITQITSNSLHLIVSSSNAVLSVLGNKYGHYYYHYLFNATFTTPLLRDGITENTVTMVIDKNNNHVDVTINGTTYGGDFVDEYSNGLSLSEFVGQYCIFEHYSYADRNTVAMPMFTEFKVSGNGTRVYDNFKRENGQLSTTPTGQIYHLMTNSINGD